MSNFFDLALSQVPDDVKIRVEGYIERLGDYSPKERVIIAGTEMFFSHWVTTAGGQVPFFHYYIDGKEFGYMNHDMKREI